MNTKIIAASLLMGCMVTGAAMAAPDEANKDKVEHALAEKIALTDDSISVSEINGHMQLNGTVDSRQDAGVAMLTAADVMLRDRNGWKDIENNLQVRGE